MRKVYSMKHWITFYTTEERIIFLPLMSAHSTMCDSMRNGNAGPIVFCCAKLGRWNSAKYLFRVLTKQIGTTGRRLSNLTLVSSEATYFKKITIENNVFSAFQNVDEKFRSKERGSLTLNRTVTSNF